MAERLDEMSEECAQQETKHIPPWEEAVLRTVFECPGRGILVVDQQGIIRAINQSAELIFGYQPGQLLQRPLSDLIPDDLRQQHGKHFQDFVSSPVRRRMGRESQRLQGKRQSGEVFPIEVTLTPVSLWNQQDREDALFVAFLGDASSLTQQKKALAETEERLQIAIETAHVGIVELDIRTEELACSREAQLMFGYPNGGMERLDDLLRALHPEDAEKTRTALGNEIAGAGPLVHEPLRVQRPDGQLSWLAWNWKLLQEESGDGNVPYRCVFAFLDITNLKRTEQQLRLNEERFRIALEGAALGVWSVDLASGSFEVSPLTLRLHGLRESIPVSFDTLWQTVHPADQERLRQALQHEYRDGDSLALEYRVSSRQPHTPERWLSLQGRFLHNYGSEKGRIFGILQDISLRKRHEERLRALTAQLLTAQEEERRRIAREIHDGATQELALASIELGLLRQECGDEKMCAKISAVAEKLIGLSEDLRLLSHEFHPGILEHVGLSRALEAYCEELTGHSRVRLVFRAGPIPQNIPRSVALAFYRVAQEALRNVVKHSGAATATITLQSIESRSGAPLLRLSVVDDGKGFELREAEQGSGLGMLSIAERVRLIDGSLSVHSLPGSGTRLEVTAPLDSTPKETP